ncbi:hypothetical protein DPX16_4527, partial [Anabarilius grahami]
SSEKLPVYEPNIPEPTSREELLKCVYVDQPAGLLCFYAVETEQDSQKKQVKLLHRFKNPIKETILPGFWVGRQSSCLILNKEE